MSTETILIILLVAVIVIAAILIFRLQARAEKIKDGFQDRLADVQREKAVLESRLQAKEEYENQMREAAKETSERHAKELEQMKEVFKNLSTETSEAFKAKSAQTISELMKPVQEKFKEFSDAVKESQKDTIERHSRLEQSIKDLDTRSKSVGDEARNLANALTGYSKVQGDFGEMLLTDVLKNAGLTEGVHFETQSVMTDNSGHEIKSESGRTMIPDVKVFYPDDTIV
ncbi:MAG: DNA recombination protein RmuC, partial [Bacteroidales bacterium]|nr:DNA recombination protein RmuC [Bacteroidales bacterium]